MNTMGVLLILFVGIQTHSVIGGPSPAVETDSPSDTAYHTEADRFLTFYGYYPSSGFLPAKVRNSSLIKHSDTERTQALKLFQKFYNLPQSGKLDKETTQLMQRPRCGNPDIVSNFATMGTSADFDMEEEEAVSETTKHHENQDRAETRVNMDREKRSLDMSRKKQMKRKKVKWTEKEMRWMVTQPSKNMPAYAHRLTMKLALSRWDTLVPFKFVETNDVSKAQLRFIFHPFPFTANDVLHKGKTWLNVKGTTMEPLPKGWDEILRREANKFEGKSSIRTKKSNRAKWRKDYSHAHASAPTSEAIREIHFDDSYHWGFHELKSVAVHEIGHALGLGHNNFKASVMNPYNQQVAGYFSVADLKAAKSIYGSRYRGEQVKWTEKEMNWMITQPLPWMPPEAQRIAMRRALSRWAPLLPFKFVETTDVSKAHLRFSSHPFIDEWEDRMQRETTAFGDVLSTRKTRLEKAEEWVQLLNRGQNLLEELFSTKESPVDEEGIKGQKQELDEHLERETIVFLDKFFSRDSRPAMDKKELKRKKQEWDAIREKEKTLMEEMSRGKLSSDVGEIKRKKQAQWRKDYSHAHALDPTSQPIREIHFDENYDWDFGELESVALHEIGHALGLGHNNHPMSVMNPYNKGVSYFSLADLRAVKSIYGSKDGALDQKMCDAKFRELDNIFRAPVHPYAQSYYIISGNRIQLTSEREKVLTYYPFKEVFPNAPSTYSVVFSSRDNKVNFLQGRNLIQHDIGAKNGVNTLHNFNFFTYEPKFAVNIDTPAGRRTRIFTEWYSWDVEFRSPYGNMRSDFAHFSRSYSSALRKLVRRAKFAVQWKDGLIYIVTRDGRYATMNVKTAYNVTDTVSRKMSGHPGWMRRLLCKGRAALCDGPICHLSRGHSTKAWGISGPALILVVALSLFKLY